MSRRIAGAVVAVVLAAGCGGAPSFSQGGAGAVEGALDAAGVRVCDTGTRTPHAPGATGATWYAVSTDCAAGADAPGLVVSATTFEDAGSRDLAFADASNRMRRLSNRRILRLGDTVVVLTQIRDRSTFDDVVTALEDAGAS